MARKEGVLSLTGGLSASMLRELVYSGIRMGTYEYFKDKFVSFQTRLGLHKSTYARVLADCTQRQKVHLLGKDLRSRSLLQVSLLR